MIYCKQIIETNTFLEKLRQVIITQLISESSFVEINTVLNILFFCEPSDFQFPGSESVGLKWVGPGNLHFYQDAYLGKHILISAQASRLLRSFMSEMKFSCDYKPSNIVWISVILPWSEKNVSR